MSRWSNLRRLATYDNCLSITNASRLASAGFYFDKCSKTVTCERCHESLGCDPDADYIAIHGRKSPYCIGNADENDDDYVVSKAQQYLNRAGIWEPISATLEADCVPTLLYQQRGTAWNQQDSSLYQLAALVLPRYSNNAQVGHRSVVGHHNDEVGHQFGRSSDRGVQRRESDTINGRRRQGTATNELMEEDSGAANGSGVGESLRLGASEDEQRRRSRRSRSSSDEEEPKLELVEPDEPCSYPTGWSDEERSGGMWEGRVLRQEGERNPSEEFDPNGAIRCIPDQPNAARAAATAEPVQAKTCKICDDRDKDCVLLPCGHAICMLCATRVQHCPFCRKKIEMRHPLFM